MGRGFIRATKAFYFVILSDERSEESKDPYIFHPLYLAGYRMAVTSFVSGRGFSRAVLLNAITLCHAGRDRAIRQCQISEP
jgi:hypothetical protein